MFSWLIRKRKSPNAFMGFDLDVWSFLGTTSCTFVDGKTVQGEAVFYLFCKKDDHTQRDFAMSVFSSYLSKKDFESHPYFQKYVIPWRLNGMHLARLINSPSEWLKEQYKNEHNLVWDHKANKWVSRDVEIVNQLSSVVLAHHETVGNL